MVKNKSEIHSYNYYMQGKYKLLFVFVACFALMPINAQIERVTKEKIDYVLKDGKAYIIGFDKKATRLTIVSDITYKKQTYRVVGVKFESHQFNEQTSSAREMVFAEGVTSVFDKIANGMTMLEKVELPNSIVSIGRYAFRNCQALKEIKIPHSVKKIDFLAFAGCSSLQTVELQDGLQEIGGSAFSSCSSLKKIVLPHSLKKIGKQAFYKCSSLSEIVITSSVSDMGADMFFGCSALTTAIIQCDIKEIPESFFNGCNSLKSIVIPNSVKVVKMQAFKGCTSLTEIILPDNAKYVSDENAAKTNSIYKGSFFGCTGLTNIKCYNGSVPADILKYIPKDCPFAQNGGKSKNPDFDTPLFANMAKYISGESMDVFRPHQDKQVVMSDVDMYIPETNIINDSTFAVIIGNENYKSVPPVAYAKHDAKIFAEYCKNTLGLPEKNISVFYDASYAEMIKALKLLKMLSQVYGGKFKVLFYYSGHGIPNESTHDAFLLPVDADGTITEVCYGVSKLYKDLNDVKANRTLVFLDACFSGARRDGGVLQALARGVVMKARNAEPSGNMLVFSAATGDETAYPFEGKSHGMFTYYLLKKIKETKGNVTLGDLADYIKTNVNVSSVTVNKKRQTPTITPSHDIVQKWTEFKLNQ